MRIREAIQYIKSNNTYLMYRLMNERYQILKWLKELVKLRKENRELREKIRRSKGKDVPYGYVGS